MPRKYTVFLNEKCIGQVNPGCWICEHQDYGGPTKDNEVCQNCSETDISLEPIAADYVFYSNFELSTSVASKP